MTKETLDKANYIVKRLEEIDALLSSLEDESNPLGLQAGLQQPVEFFLNTDITNPIKELDESYYKQFIMFLKAYRDNAKKIFDNLGN